ncbi:phospholipase A2 inhibitor and Ly6/PLAUR domain-containing protein-like [Anomaloglossus baeobatrachus]|uniref:phospholipase A2 inhibitor and Ly6/PLAUR domain-containing protein-like n=1 Tax=Anomaloglossus baeobatrachus TaxID=238106 RepID=UPI003F50A702
MSSLIALLSLLSTLSATSYALLCTQCMSPSSTCSGKSVTCPSGHVCGAAYSEFIYGGKKTASMLRSCTPSYECNTFSSITTSKIQLRMVTSCCGTDDCTPSSPALPAKDTNPNGLVCQSCTAAKSIWCNSPHTIECTGDENTCFVQTTKLSGNFSDFSVMRGCATQSVCELGNRPEKMEGYSIDVKTICIGGSTSVYKVVLTPAFVCLLLLKLFF